MGTTDYGTQTLGFAYLNDATSESFNGVYYNVLSPGIYTGFTLTKASDSSVTISSGTCIIKDTDTGVSTKIATEDDQSITVSSSIPYLVLRFTWASSSNNYMDMFAVSYDDIADDDLIVGRCVFDDTGTTMDETFDTTRKNNVYSKLINTQDDYLKVYQTEPASNQVTVTSGVINTSKGNKIVSGSTYPTDGFSDTTLGRTDLIYVDDSGDIQILEGTDSESSTTPEYENRKVIAEITRGAGETVVKGNEITRVIDNFDESPLSEDMLLDDDGEYFSNTNVEDALQEIAGSDFSFYGTKNFKNISITPPSSTVAEIIQGADSENIQEIKTSDETIVHYIDSTGKLYNTIGSDLTVADTYSNFDTNKIDEALDQVAGEAMTIDGTKTFNDSPLVPTLSDYTDDSTTIASTSFVQTARANTDIFDQSLNVGEDVEFESLTARDNGTLTFDGSSTYVSADNPFTESGTAWSISGEFNVSDLTTQRYVLTCRDSFGEGIFLSIFTNGLLRVSAGGTTTYTSEYVTTDTDYKFVITGNSSERQIYIDGSLAWSDTNSGVSTGFGDIFVIGAYVDGTTVGGSLRFPGTIKNIRVYDAVLTTAQIETLSNDGYVSDGLTNEWRLTEGSGSDAIDTEGDLDGTIYNGTWTDVTEGSLTVDGVVTARNINSVIKHVPLMCYEMGGNYSGYSSVSTVNTNTGCISCCFGGTYIWAVNYNVDTVSKINATTNEVENTISVEDGPWGCCFDGTYVWVCNYSDSTLSKINTETDTVDATLSSDISGPRECCYDSVNDYIWLTNSSGDSVTKYDPSTNSAILTCSVGSTPYGICFDGTYIWVCNYDGSTVSKIDVSTNSVDSTISVGTNPRGCCFDGTYVWVCNYGGNTVSKIDVSTNSVDSTISVGANPYGCCFDGTYIWVCNVGGSTVSKINAGTSTVENTITVGTNPYGCCFGGTYVWVTNAASANIQKLLP